MAAGAWRLAQHTQYVFAHHVLWAHAGHAAAALDRAQLCFQLVWSVTYNVIAGHDLQAVPCADPVKGHAVSAEDYAVSAEDHAVPAEEHAVPAEGYAVPAEEHTVHADGHAVHAEGQAVDVVPYAVHAGHHAEEADYTQHSAGALTNLQARHETPQQSHDGTPRHDGVCPGQGCSWSSVGAVQPQTQHCKK